jgi:hypothetical protein
MVKKKAARKRREATVMVSVRFPLDLEERSQVAARFHKMSFQEWMRRAAQAQLGDL